MTVHVSAWSPQGRGCRTHVHTGAGAGFPSEAGREGPREDTGAKRRSFQGNARP